MKNTRERTCTVVEVASGSSGPCMNEACTQLRSVHHLSVTHSRCACVAILASLARMVVLSE